MHNLALLLLIVLALPCQAETTTNTTISSSYVSTTANCAAGYTGLTGPGNCPAQMTSFGPPAQYCLLSSPPIVTSATLLQFCAANPTQTDPVTMLMSGNGTALNPYFCTPVNCYPVTPSPTPVSTTSPTATAAPTVSPTATPTPTATPIGDCSYLPNPMPAAVKVTPDQMRAKVAQSFSDTRVGFCHQLMKFVDKRRNAYSSADGEFEEILPWHPCVDGRCTAAQRMSQFLTSGVPDAFKYRDRERTYIIPVLYHPGTNEVDENGQPFTEPVFIGWQVFTTQWVHEPFDPNRHSLIYTPYSAHAAYSDPNNKKKIQVRDFGWDDEEENISFRLANSISSGFKDYPWLTCGPPGENESFLGIRYNPDLAKSQCTVSYDLCVRQMIYPPEVQRTYLDPYANEFGIAPGSSTLYYAAGDAPTGWGYVATRNGYINQALKKIDYVDNTIRLVANFTPIVGSTVHAFECSAMEDPSARSLCWGEVAIDYASDAFMFMGYATPGSTFQKLSSGLQKPATYALIAANYTAAAIHLQRQEFVDSFTRVVAGTGDLFFMHLNDQLHFENIRERRRQWVCSSDDNTLTDLSLISEKKAITCNPDDVNSCKLCKVVTPRVPDDLPRNYTLDPEVPTTGWTQGVSTNYPVNWLTAVRFQHQAQVMHGTIVASGKSILKDGIKNLGKGAGGYGLYLAPEQRGLKPFVNGVVNEHTPSFYQANYFADVAQSGGVALDPSQTKKVILIGTIEAPDREVANLRSVQNAIQELDKGILSNIGPDAGTAEAFESMLEHGGFKVLNIDTRANAAFAEPWDNLTNTENIYVVKACGSPYVKFTHAYVQEPGGWVLMTAEDFLNSY